MTRGIASRTPPAEGQAAGGASFDNERPARRQLFLALFHALRLDEPSWITSAAFHVFFLVALGMWKFEVPVSDLLSVTLQQGDDVEEAMESLESEAQFALDPQEDPAQPMALPGDISQIDLALENPLAALEASTAEQPTRDPSLMLGKDALEGVASPGLSGREERRRGAAGLGATKKSEAAVDLALEWLAAHQMSDGSWSFDHRRHPGCRGRCKDEGAAVAARNAATAMGLLPFLGAGHTHRQGKYQRNVAMALKFLIENQGSGGSFHEPQGSMYSHGLATLALCEALAMDVDESPSESQTLGDAILDPGALASAAQAAVYFIEQAQHPAGGWRYNPGEPGDTSVVGWQMMALVSGRMAGLTFDARTLARASRFLDSVSTGDYAEYYGYKTRGPRPSTTAIGLLCRMYLGWDEGHPGIANGAEYLSQTGYSDSDMYYNYYATQVMHHYGGPLWKNWNKGMREYLIRTQDKKKHQRGSWFFPDPYGGRQGGRLYSTALAAMTLEVYYRYMPIYGARAIGSEVDDAADHAAPEDPTDAPQDE